MSRCPARDVDVASISYLCRRGARYHYRRRLFLRKLVNEHISIPLKTADPAEARGLVARLSVRWDVTMMTMREKSFRGYMTASEAVAVFRRGLDEELGLATADRFDDDSAGEERTARVFEAMYRVAARLDPSAEAVESDLLATYTSGFSDVDQRALILMLKALTPQRTAGDEALVALEAVGAPTNVATVRDARVQILLGKAEAHARAALLMFPDVIAMAGDPVSRLLDDAAVTAFRRAERVTPSEPLSPAPPPPSAESDSPYLSQDIRRFSEIIEPTIAAIQAAGDWNEDMAQRRRVLNAFSWITGDKRLCDYRPADAELFAQTLAQLPTSFRWGSPAKGAMSRPFSETLPDLPTATKSDARSPRTLNRDLTTMSRFARQLAKVAWKAKLGGAPIMNFNDFTAGVREDINDPDRMPWTEENLRVAFSSPIYTGGGRCMKRLKQSLHSSNVWHDAAYWVPLIMAYTFIAREEACGLELVDFVFDVSTPYIIIRANMTRSRDGATPGGLKRSARFRMIPIHPHLLRLGLQAYVEKIAEEGYAMAFPELYQDQHTKRGGTRFYASAGRYLLAYVDQVEPLPRTRKGKRADLHSMRTSGASALEDSDAKQLQVDDIMGHAREGMGPRKYSRAWYLKGGGAILSKRLQLMVDVMPDVTSHLIPAPVRLLPLAERSRTGSAAGCVSRQKA